MTNHLIIGFGKWSKKIIFFLQNKKLYEKIYIKTRKNYFELEENKIIDEKDILKKKIKIKSAHICTPSKTHYYYLKYLRNYDKIIVEKPFLNNLKHFEEIKKIYSKKIYLLVNYTYLFSPNINFLSKHLKKFKCKEIVLNFSNKNPNYKKKYDSLKDWLDHPLSIILFFFKSFPKSKITKIELIKKKNLYEKLIINYDYKKFIVKVKINTEKNDTKNIVLKNEGIILDFNRNNISKNNQILFKPNSNSFDILYDSLYKRKKLSFQSYNFHKMIIHEKRKLLKKIQMIKL